MTFLSADQLFVSDRIVPGGVSLNILKAYNVDDYYPQCKHFNIEEYYLKLDHEQQKHLYNECFVDYVSQFIPLKVPKYNTDAVVEGQAYSFDFQPDIIQLEYKKKENFPIKFGIFVDHFTSKFLKNRNDKVTIYITDYTFAYMQINSNQDNLLLPCYYRTDEQMGHAFIIIFSKLQNTITIVDHYYDEHEQSDLGKEYSKFMCASLSMIEHFRNWLRPDQPSQLKIIQTKMQTVPHELDRKCVLITMITVMLFFSLGQRLDYFIKILLTLEKRVGPRKLVSYVFSQTMRRKRLLFPRYETLVTKDKKDVFKVSVSFEETIEDEIIKHFEIKKETIQDIFDYEEWYNPDKSIWIHPHGHLKLLLVVPQRNQTYSLNYKLLSLWNTDPDFTKVEAQTFFWETDLDRWEDVFDAWGHPDFDIIIIEERKENYTDNYEIAINREKCLFRHFLRKGGSLIARNIVSNTTASKFISIRAVFTVNDMFRVHNNLFYKKIKKMR